DSSSPSDSTLPATALSSDALQEMAAKALQLWSDFLARTGQTLPDGITFSLADLPAGVLGRSTESGILIDVDAGGRGWFVAPTPTDNSEFSLYLAAGRLGATDASPAAGRVDLLSVLLHEIGHQLGYDHDAPLAVMDEVLGAGQRLVLITSVLP